MSDYPDILSLIPQRPPMVMVDTIVSYSGDESISTFTIRPDNIFVNDGRLSAHAIIENMAQSCAAHFGLSQSPRLGIIGALQNISMSHLPAVGDTIHTQIHIVDRVFDMILVEASSSISTKGERTHVGSGTLKIALL